MAILKCKMCGGDITLIEGKSVAECEYCGTMQTVPNPDNEKKLALFTRANRLRALCEFDKASGVYESIVAEFPEEAEAYWGLVLCTFGIEYVDDPGTGKKIPTCHRSSFESIFEDGNFDMVMEYADSTARGVYRQEAKQIEELRQNIVAVSSKEEPYDIFICYKETAENGERTEDSVMAQEVYDALVSKKYRVFFSRITLEDKLGVEYEPYIFAALNTAKIMLVFGTCYEYFHAVWVKNEWSRFLQLKEKGEQKSLIPCFRNIAPEDMPKEFARLQSQDMSKVGAMQDLLRGIEKILPRREKSAPVPSAPQTATTETLMRRVKIYIEDGDWQNADAYCEKILDIQPENAEAYLNKLLVSQKVKEKTALKFLSSPFDSSIEYQRLSRFASSELMEELKGYNESIRIENAFSEAKEQYNKALEERTLINDAVCKARESKTFAAADNMERHGHTFRRLIGDAENLAEKLPKEYASRLEIAQLKSTVIELLNSCSYELALVWMEQAKEGNTESGRRAVQTLENLGGYKDSATLVEDARALEIDAFYRYALEHSRGNAGNAARLFEKMGNYKNAQKNAELCNEINTLQSKVINNNMLNRSNEEIVANAREQLGDQPAYAKTALIALLVYLGLIGLMILLLFIGTVGKIDILGQVGAFLCLGITIYVFVQRSRIKFRSIFNSILFTCLSGFIFILFPIEMLHEYFSWNSGTGKFKRAIRENNNIINQRNAESNAMNQKIEALYQQMQ